MIALWRRQLVAVLRIELRKTLFGRRAFPIYFLAAFPVLIAALLVLVNFFEPIPPLQRPSTAATPFALIYQATLGLVYLGCVWIFMNLFRGEVLDRSLHYYFLAPIRRELLVAAKFVAGWVATTLLFVGSTLASFAMLYSVFGISQAADYALRGAGLGQWTAYVGITTLACLGYGGVFLLVGLFFRNPLIPAVVIFLWEGINPLLPALLKRISVNFYIHSMLPVPINEGPFALMAEPVSAWLSVPGLMIFTAVTLVVASLRIRHMEIAYTSD